uniref:Mucin-2-like n=1 Tax=Labrus bergylta TaxID=56723 RepID=A0A3Q3GVH9_9LABR
MSPPASCSHSWTPRLLLTALLMLTMMTSLPVSAVEAETCFSRQHQSVIVNVRLSSDVVLKVLTTLIGNNVCVCVSKGAKCNMAVFNSNKQAGEDNCFLFHCQTEQDCPLMKAEDGINTYDIYKGKDNLTLSPTATTPTTTTTTTTPATTTPATTTTTTTTTMRKPNHPNRKQNKTPKKIKPHPVSTTTLAPPPQTSTASLIVVTAAPRTTEKLQPRTETTTTTTATPTTTTAATTTPTTTMTTPTTTTSTTTTPPTTTTTTPTTTTTTTPKTTTTTTTTTTTEPPTTRATQAVSLIIVPKGAVQSDPALLSDHALQNSSISRGKAVAARGALKSGVVAFMVLGLAVLTLALAVGGRKAMESFDRRHYTRLELNDLHYEV